MFRAGEIRPGPAPAQSGVRIACNAAYIAACAGDIAVVLAVDGGAQVHPACNPAGAVALCSDGAPVDALLEDGLQLIGASKLDAGDVVLRVQAVFNGYGSGYPAYIAVPLDDARIDAGGGLAHAGGVDVRLAVVPYDVLGGCRGLDLIHRIHQEAEDPVHLHADGPQIFCKRIPGRADGPAEAAQASRDLGEGSEEAVAGVPHRLAERGEADRTVVRQNSHRIPDHIKGILQMAAQFRAGVRGVRETAHHLPQLVCQGSNRSDGAVQSCQGVIQVLHAAAEGLRGAVGCIQCCLYVGPVDLQVVLYGIQRQA